jgi:hypothetical protein
VYHNLDYSMKFGEQQVAEGDLNKTYDARKHLGESTDPYKKKLAERLAKKIV